jgi:hypothetical protein
MPQATFGAKEKQNGLFCNGDVGLSLASGAVSPRCGNLTTRAR